MEKQDWVFGDWVVAPEDRTNHGYGIQWTLVPFNEEHGEGGAFCRGPFGRKAKEPETVIHATGYDNEGIYFDDDFLKLLLGKLNA